MHELLEPPKDQNQVRVITIVGASNRIKLGKQREREREQKLQAAQGMQCTNRCTSSRLVLSGDEQAPRELCMWRLPHHFS